jgi:membrane protein YdbS with pleckstrin-like domain
MYNAFRQFCERLLRIPPDPHPPPGDEASTQIFRAAVNYYKYLLLLWALTSATTILSTLVVEVVLVTATITDKHFSEWWTLIPAFLLLIMIVVAIFHLAVIRLKYEKRWYIITDRSLRVREGVIGVQEMTITFANIQNISIEQGPVQRLLAIADLRVDTAGGGGSSRQNQHGAPNLHTAWFRGIDNATEVRELIQQRLRHWKDAGLGDHEDAHHETNTDMISALREVYGEAKAVNVVLATQA